MIGIEPAAATSTSLSPAIAGVAAGPDPGGLREVVEEVTRGGTEDPWAFAERVWSGLRPHLRIRLWVLESLRRRGGAAGSGTAGEPGGLDRLAEEVRSVETEVDEVLRRRRDWESFSILLVGRLATCLGQLERLQQDQHERGEP